MKTSWPVYSCLLLFVIEFSYGARVPAFTEDVIVVHIQEELRDELVATLDCKTPSNVDCELAISDSKFTLTNNEIRTSSSDGIDYEALADVNFVYVLQVNGTDPTDATRQYTAVATVFVYINPVNEFSPTFVGAPFTASVPEDARVGYNIIQLSGEDRDLGVHGQILFSITAGNEDGKFDINPSTGRIFTNGTLDFETRTSYTLKVQLSDGDRTVTEDVVINVDPVNDNYPQCTPTVYHVTMGDELALTGTTIQTLTCADLDGDSLTYSIDSGDVDGAFSMGPGATVQLQKDLDANQNPLDYLLTIRVSDGSRSTDALFRIYVIKNNTKAPEFLTNPTIQVPESQAVGTEIVPYTAQDPDQTPYGIVSYEINSVSNGGGDYFLVEERTGSIKVARPLDYELIKSYLITVVSIDGGGLKGTGTVTIAVVNENDNIPECTTYSEGYNIPEDTDVNSVISADIQCTDADGDVLTFDLNPPGSPFDLLDAANNVRVVLKEPLDFETQPFYQLDISVMDGGAVPVMIIMVINVVNVNEFPPVFTDTGLYYSTLNETSQPGVTVAMVTATDGDLDQLTYSFRTPEPAFNLGPSSGLIILSQTLDAEMTSSYVLQVLASDGQRTATARVSVTVRDVNEPPTFDKDNYAFTNVENTPVGTVVEKVVARDPDLVGNNAVFRYAIISGNINSHFFIDPDDGTITVAVPVNYEVTRSVLLVIEVTDFGLPPLSNKCTVNISIQDVNDNAPEFPTTTLTKFLPENATIDEVVTRVSAKDVDSDRDNNNVFTFRTSSAVPFDVDPDTGDVTVINTLDREFQESYEMVIEAEDGGYPPKTGQVTLTVILTDVNDNPPLILGTYDRSIPENEPVHSLIFSLSAKDPDTGDNGRYLYSIISGNPDFHFRIEQTRGYVQISTDLDRERQPLYELVIQATDLGTPRKSSTITATVTLTDVNDMTPRFNQDVYSLTVPENSIIGTSIGTISATDSDLGNNAIVTYRIKSFLEGHGGKFTVDALTGELRIIANLDREVEEFYSVKVIAEDRGSLSSEAIVNITIQDKNDNAPIFTRRIYSTEVLENFAVGGVLLSVTSHDADKGSNARISYIIDMNSLDGAIANEHFSMDPTSGEIKSIKQLDRELYANISMSVIATDGGTPAQFSNSTVTIFIEDINDNRPIFLPSFYNAEVSYEHACDHVITTVIAYDKDLEKNAEVVYEMDPIYGENQFLLDPESGQIRTNMNVNESRNVILVRAHDLGTPSLMTSLSAKIRIDSFNASETILLFTLAMKLPTYLRKEGEFLALIKATIEEFYASAYVRRWCIEDKTTAVVVYVYAVKNDLTNWESNLGLDKPFMTNGEFLESLELNENNIPTINGTDKAWRDLLVTDVQPLGKNIVYPTGSSRASGGAKTSGLVIALAVIFSILALVLLVALILCLLWRRKLKKRKEDASKSKPKLIKVQSKANRSLGDPNSSEKKPFVLDGEDITGSGRHVTNVGKPLMVFPGMGSPGSRSARLKGSPTGSGLETDGDTDSMTKIDIDGGRERFVSPSGVKAGMKGSPSIASLRRGVVKGFNNAGEDGHVTSASDGKSSARTFENRGIDPVTGWVYEDNVDKNGRQWLRTPDGDPIFQNSFI